MMASVEIELYYYPKDRLFTDLDGFEIRDIYRYLDPSDLKILWYYNSSMDFTNGIYMVHVNVIKEDKYDDPFSLYF